MSLLQQNNYIVTFYTHSGAVAYRRFLSKQGVESEMMPVPRSLSSSCGLCVSFQYEDISSIVTTDVDSIYRMVENKPVLVYENEE